MNHQAIYEKAGVLRCEGNTKSSFKEYKKLIASKDFEWRIQGYSGMALCLKMDYKLEPAMYYYNKAAALCEKVRYYSKLGDIYRDMAITYEYFAKYKLAEKILNKAIYIFKRLEMTKMNYSKLGITEVKLGVVYLHQNQLAKAEKWLKKGDRHLAKGLAKGEGTFWKLTSKGHLAELLFLQKKYKKTIEIINPLIYQARRKDWLHRYAQFLILRGACFKKLNRKKEADRDIKLALNMANHFDSKEVADAIKKRLRYYLNK